jgi:hypothetical protein
LPAEANPSLSYQHLRGYSTVKLEGSLDTFPLRELIDMVVYSSVTGVLNIFGPGEAGRLYFRDSVLYHAERGAADGLQALGELFEIGNGSFSFVSKATSPSESLSGSLDSNLFTAERMAARWRQIRPYVPSLDYIPNLLLSPEVAIRRVNVAHTQLLHAIDGRSNLRALAAATGWAQVDVAEAIVQMILDGFVEIRTAQAPAKADGARAPAPRAGGLFDRARSEPLSLPDGDRGQGPTQASMASAPETTETLILQLLRSSS